MIKTMEQPENKNRREILNRIQEKMEELKSNNPAAAPLQFYRNDFTIFDFTPYDDKELVKRAFNEFFKRNPNEKEELFYINALRSHRINKQEFLALLSQSEEGKSHNIRIEAMNPSYLHYPFLVRTRGEEILSGSVPVKKDYNLFELINIKDEDFIASMYRIILSRDPDPTGYEYFINSMQSGRFNKLEIIGRIRFSGEGIRKGVKIRGLFIEYLKERIRRLPVFGSFIADLLSVMRVFSIPSRLFRLERFMEESYSEFQKSYRLSESRFNLNIDQILSLFNEYIEAEQMKVRSDLLPASITGSAVFSLITTENLTLQDISLAFRNARELLPEGGMVVVRVAAPSLREISGSSKGPFPASVVTDVARRHGYRHITTGKDREGRPIVTAGRP